jgi:hypothetical protein
MLYLPLLKVKLIKTTDNLMTQINITFTFININTRFINQKRTGIIKIFIHTV